MGEKKVVSWSMSLFVREPSTLLKGGGTRDGNVGEGWSCLHTVAPNLDHLMTMLCPIVLCPASSLCHLLQQSYLSLSKIEARLVHNNFSDLIDMIFRSQGAWD
jgi:hypothetical protein